MEWNEEHNRVVVSFVEELIVNSSREVILFAYHFYELLTEFKSIVRSILAVVAVNDKNRFK